MHTNHDLPVSDWRQPGRGTRTRVALWLLSEVGEGGSFTKAQLRGAFPGVEQVDRRMRDLRAEGWKIATYREDRSLSVDELRLVSIGGHVWETNYRSRQPAVSDSERALSLERDAYACRLCGIGAGETYPDSTTRTAKLSVERLLRRERDELRTVCDRCFAGRGSRELKDDTTSLLAEVLTLSDRNLATFATWAETNRRERSIIDTLWTRFRALPAVERDEIRRSSGAAWRAREESNRGCAE